MSITVKQVSAIMKGGKNSLRIYRDNNLIFLRHQANVRRFLLVDLCLENLYFLIKPIILTMRRQKSVTNPPEIET